MIRVHLISKAHLEVYTYVGGGLSSELLASLSRYHIIRISGDLALLRDLKYTHTSASLKRAICLLLFCVYYADI